MLEYPLPSSVDEFVIMIAALFAWNRITMWPGSVNFFSRGHAILDLLQTAWKCGGIWTNR